MFRNYTDGGRVVHIPDRELVKVSWQHQDFHEADELIVLRQGCQRYNNPRFVGTEGRKGPCTHTHTHTHTHYDEPMAYFKIHPRLWHPQLLLR